MARGHERTPLRHRARYLFDRTLARSTGTLLGWLAVCCLAVVVPVSTLLVWTDPAAPRSFSGRLTQVWRTSAETLRLGAVAGTPARMLLSVLLGLIALLCVSTVVGVVTTGLGDRLAELRRGRSRVLERDHDVVLGWTDQIFTVVAELTEGRAGAGGSAGGRSGGGRHVVTVLADRDPAHMEAALTAALGGTDRVRLVCRTGVPTDPDALALVTPGAARAVVVLPADEPDGDLTVVRTLLALRALPGADDGPGAPRVIAAVHDGRYLPAARLAAGPRGTVLETDRTAARLLVQAARRPGMPAALRDLLDFSGAEFHVTDVPEAVGLSFEEVALRLDTSCVVGVLRPDGRPLLTPAPHTVLGPGDRLVTVAHDDRTTPLTDRWARVDTAALAPPAPLPEPPARLLLLGWNRRAPLIVDALRRTARPGSVLDVITDTAPDPAGHGSPRSPGPPHDARLTVTHHVRDLAAPEALNDLDLAAYDSVIALGADRTDQGTGSERSDERTLLALLTLRSWEELTGRVLPVVAELRDHRGRTVAPLGPASHAVVRGELTALLMAQIAQNPELAAVFEEIFAVRGGALALRPAAHYVLPGHEAAFATVVAAALERGECAIGYHAHDPRAARPYDGVLLCPGKAERRVWRTEDRILVLTAGPGHEADLLPAQRPGQIPGSTAGPQIRGEGRGERPA
ncbi:CASTOR/POLLUX-related putative ion channel [Streptomyces arenae]|uniref:CASTOR/POLLUX-related putative ion channel n=1 Tax=Streptomyces arenae TaxID=29301 RepID=UPI0026592AA0|nr:NAD-binding lipoprotein [Streptomyces arenae]MCG7208476.1 NAD-binding lipoprotein [Streptomyces arenae]